LPANLAVFLECGSSRNDIGLAVKSHSLKFNKEKLREYLSALNDELKALGVTGDICIVGGAAMILAFGSRESTRDIDALLLSPSQIRAAAATVAQDLDLPANWLNDGAKGYASELLHYSHLRVITPPAQYILAMKCIAARVGLDDHDKEDAKFLIEHLGLRNSEAVLEIVAKYYDAKRIPAKTQYFVREVCDELFSKT
jgi:antitoxin component of RelBE/YafQ-DinJ toxin-antitoxin module